MSSKSKNHYIWDAHPKSYNNIKLELILGFDNLFLAQLQQDNFVSLKYHVWYMFDYDLQYLLDLDQYIFFI